MAAKLALIHTIARLAAGYDELCDELMPDVQRFHIADEGLLQLLMAAGGMTPAIYKRFADDAVCAEQAGADLILLTCSSISPAADVARNMVSVPVLKIDEPMADQAVALGRRIGLVGTAETALKATTQLIQSRARLAGKEVQVEPIFCAGAHKLMLAGDMDRHDQLVIGHLRRALQDSDVVVLAQGSMARVADQIPAAERRVPILSSPRMGMERVRDVIRQLTP
jgi:Asp/Glu/hydantoin racemase